MQTDLLKQLYRPELFDTLMVEDKSIAQQRAVRSVVMVSHCIAHALKLELSQSHWLQECLGRLKQLTQAQTIVNQIKDYDVYPEAFSAQPASASHSATLGSSDQFSPSQAFSRYAPMVIQMLVGPIT